jgi:2-polyprenyl-3-methyl-5-hydroxy-6-metoxy-1,4-benzoquinol methylase
VCETDLDLFGPCTGYTYYRCPQCGTIQLSPMPDAAELAKSYAADYLAGAYKSDFEGPEWWRKASRPYRDAILATLRDHQVQGSVIDYGTGWGHLVEDMIEHGYQARGLEFSRRPVAYAQERGVPVQQGGLDVLTGMDGQLSALTMSAVFEHIADHDRFLAQVRALLKDDGLFITLHPTAAIYYLLGNLMRLGNRQKELPNLAGAIVAPWHTVLFSVRGTVDFISRHGFRLISIRPAPQGRLGGVLGAIQIALELVNKAGWSLFGTRWPLVTTHIFVFQRC